MRVTFTFIIETCQNTASSLVKTTLFVNYNGRLIYHEKKNEKENEKVDKNQQAILPNFVDRLHRVCTVHYILMLYLNTYVRCGKISSRPLVILKGVRTFMLGKSIIIYSLFYTIYTHTCVMTRYYYNYNYYNTIYIIGTVQTNDNLDSDCFS